MSKRFNVYQKVKQNCLQYAGKYLYRQTIVYVIRIIIITGTQTRSRVVISPPNQITGGRHCSETTLEIRPCGHEPPPGFNRRRLNWGVVDTLRADWPDLHCPRYYWHNTEWFGDRRQVWCQSSTGMVVEGKFVWKLYIDIWWVDYNNK
jgi:hypothetical protein